MRVSTDETNALAPTLLNTALPGERRAQGEAGQNGSRRPAATTKTMSSSDKRCSEVKCLKDGSTASSPNFDETLRAESSPKADTLIQAGALAAVKFSSDQQPEHSHEFNGTGSDTSLVSLRARCNGASIGIHGKLLMVRRRGCLAARSRVPFGSQMNAQI